MQVGDLGPQLAAFDYTNCRHEYTKRAGWAVRVTGRKQRRRCLVCGRRMLSDADLNSPAQDPYRRIGLYAQIGRALLAGGSVKGTAREYQVCRQVVRQVRGLLESATAL